MAKRYVFPGDRPFIDRAAEENRSVEGPVDPGDLRKIPAFNEVGRLLTNLSNLQTDEQSLRDNPEGVRKLGEDFLAKARAARDRIALALRAADLMIEEVAGAVQLPEAPEPEPTPTPEPEPPDVGQADRGPTSPVPSEQGTGEGPVGDGRSWSGPGPGDVSYSFSEEYGDPSEPGDPADESKPRRRGRPRKNPE